MPRSFRKDSLPGPYSLGVAQALPTQPGTGSVYGARTSPSPIAHSMATQEDVFLHSSPLLLEALPRVLVCLNQAGPGTIQLMAFGTGTKTFQQQYQSTTQHQEKPRSTLQTSQACSAGVQA